MRILLVHADKTPWATQRRAEALKREWKDDLVNIAYFKDLPDGKPYDVIHFLFSGGIGKCKEYILQHKDKVFTTLASHRTIEGYFDPLATLKEIFQNSVGCVCQNKKLFDFYTHLTRQPNATYIPNGVDTELFNRKFVVGFVGRRADDSDHKGYALVDQACQELGLHLMAQQSGFIEHKDMKEFYESIDCLVVMSKSEGCNNPTLEALAMNKPVISTDTGIAADLEGVTLVERDVESLKKALRKAAGRIQILEEYTWHVIAAKYKKFYENMLNR